MTSGILASRPPLRGRCAVPGDKSISHRALLLAGMARGTSHLFGVMTFGDCERTMRLVRALGPRVHEAEDGLTVTSDGAGALVAPEKPIDCARSATTMRLAAGLLAGGPHRVTLTGDPQLLRRPMERVAEPLREMGATIRTADGRAPLFIRGADLRGIRYELPVASAQVKSAVLLAGVQASGATTVVEPFRTRDHTERLLAAMGARVELRRTDGHGASVSVRHTDLEPLDLRVPGDVSSAAPFVAAATLVAGSELLIEGVGLNPTRTGFLRILDRMGGRVEILGRQSVEPVGDLLVRHAELTATRVDADEIPSSIDELPLIAVLATQAEGVTEIRGAGELRVKESDRVSGLVAGLRALGAEAEELSDGFVVRGPCRLRGGSVDALRDHRLAMAFVVAEIVAEGEVVIAGREFIADSFAGFDRRLEAAR